MNPNFYYDGVYIGHEIRRSIGQTKTYRVRSGNGFYGTTEGVKYQDCYTYFVPSSITNVEGQHSRDVFASAVSAWQVLSEAEKDVWRQKERHISGKSGYNIYISYYMKENL